MPVFCRNRKSDPSNAGMAQMKPQPPLLPAALRAPLAGVTLPWGELLLLAAILAVLTIGA